MVFSKRKIEFPHKSKVELRIDKNQQNKSDPNFAQIFMS
jgi:hypothetical protein